MHIESDHFIIYCLQLANKYPARPASTGTKGVYELLPSETSEQLDAFPGNGRVWDEVKKGNALNKLFWEGGGAPADVFLITASAQVSLRLTRSLDSVSP